MDFVSRGEVGIFDWLGSWSGIGILAILVLICVEVFVFVFKFFDFSIPGAVVSGIFFMLIGLFFPAMGFSAGFMHEVKVAQEENIAKVFNVSDNQKYTRISPAEDGKFSDVKTFIKNSDEQVLREVTFGFKESGEPFIYENGEVDKDFITSLKK